ncbi:MAG: MotA/TolQ/ExbB proton channel family protein [Planctomycetes bacterium]|nr:MotA/TolQ/ExbB proton channel family protein [Planctomycetota bacterium]MBL7042915.1 MotA/TolQ/ExbB proton channel family protein [Pirellulaceae bacterium]
MDIEALTRYVGYITYFALIVIALWGAFCVVMVWSRVAQKRFRNEEAQQEFLSALEQPLERGDFDGAGTICEGDPRAVPQLTLLAIVNRAIGFNKVRQLVIDRLQRDVMADLEYRVSWVNTVIKAAPMVGLFGTVIGMMGAFAKLAAAENVKPDQLAENISVALITTASGLAIAIPLVIGMASINVRIRKMEDLAISGLTRVLESFRRGLDARGKRGG